MPLPLFASGVSTRASRVGVIALGTTSSDTADCAADAGSTSLSVSTQPTRQAASKQAPRILIVVPSVVSEGDVTPRSARGPADLRYQNAEAPFGVPRPVGPS